MSFHRWSNTWKTFSGVVSAVVYTLKTVSGVVLAVVKPTSCLWTHKRAHGLEQQIALTRATDTGA